MNIDNSEETRLKLRELGKMNLYFFIEGILGYKDLNKELHGEVTNKLMRGENDLRKLLFLLPRLHLKSTVITKGYSIWRIVRNPNIRILLSSETATLAKGLLREIKSHFEKNQILRWLYPEIIPPDFEKTKWTEDEILVPRNEGWSESTIETAGLDSGIVSKHYDVIIKDDLVSNKNVGTEGQRQMVIEWHKQSLNLLMPNGNEIILGTRWHYYDLYSYLLEKGSYDSMVRGCIENGLPILPELFTIENLEEKRKEMGAYIFSCQMCNNPVDDENATFKRSWLKNYEYNKITSKLYITMTIDPALEPENEKKNDYTAIVVCGTDELNNIYVLKYLRGKWSPNNTLEHIFMLHKEWNVDVTGIETVAFQKLLKFAIEDKMRKDNYFFSLEELKSGGRSKELRIRALQPRFENGAIFLTKDMQELEDELLSFPKSKNDDLIDALAYHLELIKDGEPQEKELVFRIENHIKLQDHLDMQERLNGLGTVIGQNQGMRELQIVRGYN